MPPLLPAKAKSEEHGTPQKLFDIWNEEFHFTLDAAASDLNRKCAKYYTKEQDGTKQSWAGEVVFCNPPYNHKALLAFTEKAIQEANDNWVTTLLFVPVKSDQLWWHRLLEEAEVSISVEYRWIMGRVQYEGNEGKAGFPSVAIVVEPLI